jgi:hypothetical protein
MHTPDLFDATSPLLSKPIEGGPFGRGRFALASRPCVRAGLHAAQYLVIEPRGGLVLGISDDKAGALQQARRVLTAANDLAGDLKDDNRQGELFPGIAAESAAAPTAREVSRRRREVFERSAGKCHYCGAVLALDGTWHIEHMMPRALGGDDNAMNLVAACVRCNLEKRDRTAIEFVARAANGN